MKHLTKEELIDLLRYHIGFVEQNNLNVDIDLCVNVIKEVDYDEDAIKQIYAFKEELDNASDKEAGNRIYNELFYFWRRETGKYGTYEEY